MNIYMGKTLSGIIVSLFYSVSVHAAVSLSAEVSEKQVTHTYSDTEPGNEPGVFKGDIGSIIVGASYNKDKFFSSLNMEQSWKDEAVFLDTDVLLFLDRVDYALTIGYSIASGISVFGGYKYGETTIKGIGIGFDPDPSQGANDLSFIEEGPFIGISYSYPVSEKSNLGLSIAYADMDAETENRIDPTGDTIDGAGPPAGTGSTDGYSAGITWSHELSESTLLNIGLKINSYDAEGTNDAGFEYSLESDYKFMTLGLRHYF